MSTRVRPMLSNSHKPRKIPRQERSKATFNVILEATAHILESVGFDKFNTNAVAQKSGVSIGSLYQYFPSKEALLAELVRAEREILYKEIVYIFEKKEQYDLKKLLKMFIERAIHHQFKRPDLALALEYASVFYGIDYEECNLQEDLEKVIAQVFLKFKMPNESILARDVIAISKGIINVAAIAKEKNIDDIQHRVEKAIYGYLEIT